MPKTLRVPWTGAGISKISFFASTRIRLPSTRSHERLRTLWTGCETMEFLLMMLIHYESSARLGRTQYLVAHLKSERRTLMRYYVRFATRRLILSIQPWSSRRSTKYFQRRKAKKGKARAKDIESALDWCRNKKVKPSGVDEDSPAFNKIVREIEDALDWIRTDGVSPHVADRLPDFSQIESIPVSRRTP
jgi:hypothetical protein